MKKKSRGQGAFEYILMLSGVLLIVILIMFIWQNALSGTNNTLTGQRNTTSTINNVSIIHLYSGTTYNLTVYEATGNVNSTTFPCCTWNATGGCGAGVTYGCQTNTNGVYGTNITCPSRNFDIKNGRCV